MRKQQDILAFDFASSRAYDEDGHLKVKQTPISKACVNPYRGEEIPECYELGLDPNKVYHLLRDPVELEKAAPSFNGKPLLFGHRAITADSHDHDSTCGALSNVTWKSPYLLADLACWTRVAIDGIEDNSQKQLSSSYRYRAVMTPGIFGGVRYDGKMTQIRGNHCALVPVGRAGADVVVHDEAFGGNRRPDPQEIAAAMFAFSGKRSPAEIAAATGTTIRPPNRWSFDHVKKD